MLVELLTPNLQDMKAIGKTLVVMLIFTASNAFSQYLPNNKHQNSSNQNSSNETSARYYYYPNLQAYFDSERMVYIYRENGKWQTAEELPVNYGGYSLYSKVRVKITDYSGEEPHTLLPLHKKKYPYNAKGRFTYATASSN